MIEIVILLQSLQQNDAVEHGSGTESQTDLIAFVNSQPLRLAACLHPQHTKCNFTGFSHIKHSKPQIQA